MSYFGTTHDEKLERRTTAPSVPESRQHHHHQSLFSVQPLKKIQFNEQDEVKYMSTDETELRSRHKSDIWYMRSDLMNMRKNDRHSLLLALRTVAANAKDRANVLLHGSAPPPADGSPRPPPPPPPPSPSATSQVDNESEFCFRGMEIVLYKKEREDSRRRAMQAVLTEQHRQRIKESDRKQKGIVIMEPPKMHAEQRISDEYKLMTRKAYDDAYLRGLGDAQEARTIFQQSLHFPSPSSGGRQVKAYNSEDSKIPESPSTSSRDFVGDDQRDAPVDVTSPDALSDILSVKMILQRNSQLRSAPNTDNPSALRLAAKYQSDVSIVNQSWSCCTYGKN